MVSHIRSAAIPPWVRLAAFILATVVACGPVQAEGPAHAIAMHGEPLYGPEFENFAYVNPDAPKGGRLTLGIVGSFDSLNPFIVQGVPARGFGNTSLNP